MDEIIRKEGMETSASWDDETRVILDALLMRLSTKQKQLEETEKCLTKEKEDLRRLADQVNLLINLSRRALVPLMDLTANRIDLWPGKRMIYK